MWTVNKKAYGADGGQGTTGRITFVSALGMGDFAAQPICSSAPYPFPEWTVNAPQITSFTPTSASQGGGTFTINGAQMYPGLVTAVLLSGNALPVANYVTTSDTAIQVTVPSATPTGMQKVEVETTFNNQTLTSNTMLIDITR